MNLDSLSNLSDNIRCTDESTRKTKLDDIIKYSINRHNEAIKNLQEIYNFINKNIDIFDNRNIVWNNKHREFDYYTNSSSGFSNPYNCVIKSVYTKYTLYWIDHGICLFYNSQIKKVAYVTWMRNNSASYSCDFEHYDLGDLITTARKYDGIEPNWSKELWSKNKFSNINEFEAIEIKKKSDSHYKKTENIMDVLTKSLQNINQYIMQRKSNLDNILNDSSENKCKITKYVIEIKKIENE